MRGGTADLGPIGGVIFASYDLEGPRTEVRSYVLGVE
jgi:hypothetical protein